MRRTDREIPVGEAQNLLAEARHGVLSMIDAEELTTRYTSATAFGQAELVEDAATKRPLLEKMTERLAPDAPFICSDEMVANTGVIRIKVDSVTGKANR